MRRMVFFLFLVLGVSFVNSKSPILGRPARKNKDDLGQGSVSGDKSYDEDYDDGAGPALFRGGRAEVDEEEDDDIHLHYYFKEKVWIDERPEIPKSCRENGQSCTTAKDCCYKQSICTQGKCKGCRQVGERLGKPCKKKSDCCSGECGISGAYKGSCYNPPGKCGIRGAGCYFPAQSCCQGLICDWTHAGYGIDWKRCKSKPSPSLDEDEDKEAPGPQLTCSSSRPTQNVYSFTIPSSSPAGNINLLYVQHDVDRLLPLSTTALHNSLNMEQNVYRQNDFRRHTCPHIFERQTHCEFTYKMTDAQAEVAGGGIWFDGGQTISAAARASFDRGHLTPANPNRFSEKAVSNTFFCVNMAPQDPFTNRISWVEVERAARRYFATTRAGYVMTGLCDGDDVLGPTLDGYRVPACFWKLICYVDKKGRTQVVGFIGNNSLLHSEDEAGKAERTATTTTPLGQQSILNVMSRVRFIMEAWDGAETYLRKNRNAVGLPTAANCKSRRTISIEVKNEWKNFMDEPS